MHPSEARTLSSSEIRSIERSGRVALEVEVIRFVGRGRRWVLGGPSTWSKDELVREVCRIRRGEAQ